MNLGILLQAQLPQRSTQLQRELLIFNKRLVRIPAHFIKIPLLINLLLHTINHLLNLFILDMRLDQTAGSDGIGLAEQPGASAKDIVGGCDILGGAEDERIPGFWQSSGDGLSFDWFIVGDLDGERGGL